MIEPFDALSRLWWSAKTWKSCATLLPVDLFIGYALRTEDFRNGWWERRRVKDDGGFPRPFVDMYPHAATMPSPLACLDYRITRVDDAWRTPLWCWREDHPRWRRVVISANSVIKRARARLEDETGHVAFHTPDDVIDASKVMPAKSVGTRALLALLSADVWEQPRAAAAARGDNGDLFAARARRA